MFLPAVYSLNSGGFALVTVYNLNLSELCSRDPV